MTSLSKLSVSTLALATLAVGGCRVAEVEFTWEMRRDGRTISAAEAGCNQIEIKTHNWSLGDDTVDYRPCDRGRAAILTWEGDLTITITALDSNRVPVAPPWRADQSTAGEPVNLGHLIFEVYGEAAQVGTIDIDVKYQRRSGYDACDTPAGVSGSVTRVGYLTTLDGTPVAAASCAPGQEYCSECRDYFYFDNMAFDTYVFRVYGSDYQDLMCWDSGEMAIVHNQRYTSVEVQAAETDQCSY